MISGAFFEDHPRVLIGHGSIGIFKAMLCESQVQIRDIKIGVDLWGCKNRINSQCEHKKIGC
jgi:hypothetical protein